MTQSTPTISPLRQRMLDDMRMRKLAPKTQSGYLRAVQRVARFLGRAPSRVTAEDLRQFQLSLVDAGLSPTALNGTLSGLKFFLEVTLDRAARALCHDSGPIDESGQPPTAVANTVEERLAADEKVFYPSHTPRGMAVADFREIERECSQVI